VEFGRADLDLQVTLKARMDGTRDPGIPARVAMFTSYVALSLVCTLRPSFEAHRKGASLQPYA